MKTYWDLSEKARASLSRNDVERYTDAHLMLRGVLRVRPLELEPEPELPEPTEKCYRLKIGPYDDLGIAFRTPEDAEQFLDLCPLRIEARWVGTSPIDSAFPLKEVQITAAKLHGKGSLDGHGDAIKRLYAVRAENDRRQNEHAAATMAQESALAGLWEDWHACRNKAAELRRVVETLREYTITAGDPAMAARFLGKVFPEEQIREALEWYGGEYPAAFSPTHLEQPSA